jgi:SH3 domain-containing YSC84-like protein 1
MPRIISRKFDKQVSARSARLFLTCMVVLLVTSPLLAADKQKDENTLRQATNVLNDMLSDKNIPLDLLARADCVMVLPDVKKFGFGIGGSGGRGPLLCRSGQDFEGKWSAPAMYSLGGASIGLQVGGSSSDLVLLLMNRKVVNQILEGKTKMGTDATAAAGPGATAAGATDADILTYARAKGMFAGVSLGGASIEPDNDANNRLYGKSVTAADIVRATDIRPTDGGEGLVALLDNKITRHISKK